MNLTKELSDWLEEAKNHTDYQELIREAQQEIEFTLEKEKLLRFVWCMG